MQPFTMQRRLPGIRFEAQPPPTDTLLPRMDVAGFAGFAVSGPLHCPVAIEDPAAFAQIFGPDTPLPWDAEHNTWAAAHLGPCVRAFLANGGRRCWVVRVADAEQAAANRFRLPGVLAVYAGPAGSFEVREAAAWARSQGSWADDIRVGTGVTLAPTVVRRFEFNAGDQRVRLQLDGASQRGDLLRLSFPEDRLVVIAAVENIVTSTPLEPSASQTYETLTYEGRAIWWRSLEPQELGAGTASWATRDGGGSLPILSLQVVEQGAFTAVLAADLTTAPAPGTALQVVCAQPDPIWLLVADVQAQQAGASGATVVVTGPGMALLAGPPAMPDTLPRCERLQLQLSAVAAGSNPLRLENLSFVPGSARFWGALPTDAELFAVAAPGEHNEQIELWRLAAAPRFPLAGREPGLPPGMPSELDSALFTFPISVAAAPDLLVLPDIPSGAALSRDGLAVFSERLFLDPELIDTPANSVMSLADEIRYLGPATRRLQGIHALLALDEVTLVAAPDAVHRPWQPVQASDPLPAKESDPLLRPEWWHYQGCEPKALPVAEPPWGNFLDCAIRVIAPPELTIDSVAANGTLQLSWTAAYPKDAGAAAADTTTVDTASYVLEEATEFDFGDAVILYAGNATSYTLIGRSPGDYYYRVRGILGANTSDWSNGVPARVGAGGGWEIPLLPDATPPDAELAAFELLAVQRAMLRMCAARGDMLAVLSLPLHCREDEAIAHLHRLSPSAHPIFSPDGSIRDLPYSFGERFVLSYAAAYHPWLVVREESGALRTIPPDGAACGVIARRTLARGAWIAPANERLLRVVALAPALNPQRRLELHAAQLNVIRQEPNGFLTFNADTLSLDPDLLQINVRRLLHLLRRVALRLGADFVFEPHDETFRRMVRRSIEGVLGGLFARGAFVGRTPEAAYQVILRSTEQDVDQGRFLVDLKVAPALPMTFLTVRLVQVDGRTVVSEER
jgi:hypothetical protein